MYIVEIKTFNRIKKSLPNYKEQVEYINKNQGIVPIINRATRFKTKEEALEFCNTFRCSFYPKYSSKYFRIIGNMKTKREVYRDKSGDTYAIVPLSELSEFDDNRWKRLSYVFNLVIKSI